MDIPAQGEQQKLRVAFIHPDLGIGGAERLVVDAALGLQNKGHTVSIHTSHHDPTHCFDETKDGTLHVIYHKPPVFLPRSIQGKFHILFAHLRQLHLTWQLVRSLQKQSIPEGDRAAKTSGVDVFFVDQLSACLPILRFFTGRRVVFYCHFPDKLLASGEFIDEEDDFFPSAALDAAPSTSGTLHPSTPTAANANGGRAPKPTSLLKKLYRLPMDYLEERTTATADLILVNSLFTSRVFKRYFLTIKLDTKGMNLGLKKNPPRGKNGQVIGGPRVVYPGINLEAYELPIDSSSMEDENTKALVSERPTFISLNRFEAKKNIALAVNAFSLFLSNLKSSQKSSATSNLSSTRLVLAGGYDPRVQENIEVLKSLLTLVSSLNLSWAIISKTPLDIPEGINGQVQPSTAQVIFLPNFTTTQRSILLKSASTMALLYTPNNEHFGIVPVEAMACGLPVLACRSGGPKESIVDADDEASPTNFATTESTDGKEVGGEWSVLDLPKTPPSSTTESKTTRTGYLRPPDPAQWAQVLLTISTLSPSSRQAISQAARSRAKEFFSMDAMARGIERALEDAYRLGPINGKYGMQKEAITEVLVWGYVITVIVSLWLFGGTCTMGWTAALLLGSTALGSVGFLKSR